MENYRSLLAERAALERKIEQVRKREVSAVIKQINDLIAEYGLTADELDFSGAGAEQAKAETRQRGARKAGAAKKSRGRASKKSAAVVKYRNPETGQTWSGRGRAPKWLQGDREQYAV